MNRQIRLLRYVVAEGCRYVWHSVKNGVKRMLGRAPRREERYVFFRQYMLHLTGLRRIRAITCDIAGVNEGPGSQAFHVMKAIACARASGLDYLHTPFRDVAHPDRPMPEWSAAWEDVFNLGADEATCDATRRDVANTYGLIDLDLYFGPRGRNDSLENRFKSLIPEFRRKYYLNLSPRTTGSVKVAINVRRGEVSAREYSYMYTSAEKILQIAKSVKSVLEAKDVPFSLGVYGQGSTAEFEELIPIGAEFFLGADPIWTLQELVEADVLIVAKSHFSYCAGLLSDGIKIFEPCGRPNSFQTFSIAWQWMLFAELPDWLPCGDDGSVDHAVLDRRLASVLEQKTKAKARVSAPIVGKTQ